MTEPTKEQVEKWKKESCLAMSERLKEHINAQDFIGYHEWNRVDAQNAFYEGYLAACKARESEIVSKEKTIREAVELLDDMSNAVMNIFYNEYERKIEQFKSRNKVEG